MSRTHPKPTGAVRPAHPSAQAGQEGAGAQRATAAKRRRPGAEGARPGRRALGARPHQDYGDLPALAPLDLTVEPHEAVVLIGHNGSGKTTFLRMAAGLLEPSGGHHPVGGHDAGSLGARAAVSYISDNPTFYEDLSVWEHLEYVARLHGRDDWEQHAADLLGQLGLYERADDLPVTFSRGLRQKTAIALGLIRPFDVLLVDEPFVGLDAAGKARPPRAARRGPRQRRRPHGGHPRARVRAARVERCLALRDGELVYDGGTAGIDVLGLVS